MIEEKFVRLISNETGVRETQVQKAITLLTGGATIPFIARYRKDVTGGLNEEQLERIAERNDYFVSLTARRAAVLEAIAKQGQLTEDLRKAIEECNDKTRLEDLYLPYKKARRTKATVAREKGLTPLADFLWAQQPGDKTLQEFAQQFVTPEKAVHSIEEALEGARHILAERISVDIDARSIVRERMFKQGSIAAHPTKNCEGKQTKYEAYYEFREPVSKIPSHRFLAVHRGAKEGFLRMELALDDAELLAELGAKYITAQDGPFAEQVKLVVDDAYNRLLRPSLENEVIALVRERADEEAIRVFRENAQNLLLSAPAGAIKVIGVDPGMRTGCKLAVVDSTGAFIESATIFPTPPQNDVENAEKVLLALMEKHVVTAIAIGNGTGSREAARFVKQTLAKINPNGAFLVLVNEAGASIYSASKIAREEFPELDVTVRGAISIARRLQDPLAELVKIEPRHIGVGQYQHDVNQKALREGLHRTVEYCVNSVGVDLNTASVPLLRYVSGIQADTATNIVEFRTKAGGFASRRQLQEVNGVGPRVFEQCAGFLRLQQAEHPLDATGIHPEAYPIVERIAETLGMNVRELVSNSEALANLDLSAFETENIGAIALNDIRSELIKPGRDPRTVFMVPKFLEGVDSVQDLEEGMEIEGVVTNVTDFGAFIDIGVHQDGLVHLSELANRFVRDPRDVIKVGEIVKVKVIKVDKALPRISLSIKALLPPEEPKPQRPRRPARPHHGDHRPSEARPGEPCPGDGRPAVHAQAERPSAEPRRDRGDHRESGGPRPHRRDKERSAALKGSLRSGKGGGGRRPSAPQQRGSDDGALHNTQLADQLAALKAKLGSS
ncbi:MAG: RNA-binding transcriptional accessory protein [Candidatus Hydrogenedentes bacterium]|nr:RNA-binding transcriptional accessory protein [Candidatus Hydrogenedentota bacterium]